MNGRVRLRRRTVAAAIAWLALCPSVAAGQVADPDPTRFQAEIDAFVSYDAKNTPPPEAVLFVGSSSIRMWPTAERFPRRAVINRGFGGSQISDVNHYFAETVAKYAAPIVVFYAGDNDINAGKPPAQILTDYRAFVERARTARSDTDIIFIAIKPSLARWEQWPAMKEANALVERYSAANPRLHYVDVAPPMLGADGQPRPNLFIGDGLHMTPAGYDIWTDLIGRAVDAVERARH